MALRQMLLVCGLPDTVNAVGHWPTQAFIDTQVFIDFQGFATDEDFTIMAVKDVPYMIKNNNSIHQQSVILGVFHQHRIQALIHWARYQKRRGIAIVPGNWNNAALANAIERVNFETP